MLNRSHLVTALTFAMTAVETWFFQNTKLLQFPGKGLMTKVEY